MADYGTVLVGTDGSSTSFLAVDRAASIAASFGARLLLVSSYHPQQGESVDRDADVLGAEAHLIRGSRPTDDILADAEDRARKAGAKLIERVPVQGEPVAVLIRTAAEHQADLIVVGNRGLNTLSGRILGSVPAAITHRAPCDVLVVHTTP
ncbi:MAG: universal stress protein [Mycobacteriales bacterium]